MAGRVEQIVRARDARLAPLTDKRLVALAAAGVARCGELVPFDAPRPFGIPGRVPAAPSPLAFRVLRGGHAERNAAFQERGLALESVRDHMFKAPRRSEERAALAFLSEPLYQLTSWFEPKVWALWPYVADRWGAACAVDPLYALWRRRAQEFVGEQDVVVFVLEE